MIAVNDAWRLCPEADYLYGCDPHWWEVHGEATQAFAGERWTQRQQGDKDPREAAVAKRFGLNVIDGEDKPGLGRARIHYGGNSGYQAMNLAFLWGARCILMLGFDMHKSEKAHFFGDHPGRLNAQTNYAQFLPYFEPLARDLKEAGVRVINCTRVTALKCFERATVEDLRA